MEGKDSFVWYLSWNVNIRLLPDSKKLKVLKWIMDYVEDKNPPIPEDEQLKIVIENIKKDLKKALEKWKNISQVRSNAGKKGGAPKGNTNASKTNKNKQKQTKQAVNEDVYEDVNELYSSSHALAREIGMDEEEEQKYNQWLIDNKIEPKYPIAMMRKFHEANQTHPKEAQNPEWLKHYISNIEEGMDSL